MSTLTKIITATQRLIVCLAGVTLTTAHAQNQPTNPSFETPAYTAIGRVALPAGSGWTFAGTAGIERFNVPAAAGYMGDGYSVKVGGMNGVQAAYISGTGTAASLGSISQSIVFPAAGKYVLRFMAGRMGVDNALRVTVGGVAVDADITPRLGRDNLSTQLEAWWTVPFTVASAGSRTVAFTATNAAATLANGDVLWLDQIVVSAARVALPNASFESTDSTALGWTFGNGATNAAVATPGVSGGRALVSQGYSTGSVFATSDPVTVAAGKYSLSLRIAKTDPGSEACPTRFVAGGVTMAGIPAPKETELTAFTTRSFDLTGAPTRFSSRSSATEVIRRPSLTR